MIDMRSYDLETTVREQLFVNTDRAIWILPGMVHNSFSAYGCATTLVKSGLEYVLLIVYEQFISR